MNTSVFSQIARDNDLDAAQLDDIVNQAFDRLKDDYAQFEIEYNEDGVRILNFDDCTDEEKGGWKQDQAENSLTDELVSTATAHSRKNA